MCLNKDVLYTVLVMMNMVRGDPISFPLPNRYVITLRLPSFANFSYVIICICMYVIQISSLSIVYILDTQQARWNP